MPFLVVEDFGTVGLCGDPARRQPPLTDDEGDPQHFYWFWWRVGKSGKHGTNRGRWGLGRSVFAATSRIRTFFALTKRATDGDRLLMGQAKLGSHSVGNEHFVAEGFFHDVGANEKVQVPFSSTRNSVEIEEFERHFHLQRKNRNGLSIIVPYPTENLTANEVLRSVIVHYFYPILRGDLRVEVVGPEQEATMLTTESIRQVASGLEWNGGRRKEKKHVQPPFDMADWAIDQQSKQMAFTLPWR